MGTVSPTATTTERENELAAADYILLTVYGRDIKVLETPVKGKDHTWYALRLPKHSATPYGVPIPALAATLPTSVELDGVTFALKAGKTQKGAPKVSFTGNAMLPSFEETDAPERHVTIAFSEQKSGWQAIVKVNRPGGGGGGGASDEQRTAVLAGLLA